MRRDPARQPGRRALGYSRLYAESARYFTAAPSSLHYTEARQGLSWRLGPRLVISPHVSGEGGVVQEQALTRWYLALGPGLSGQVFLDRSGQRNIEIAVRYRAATSFADRSGDGSRRFDGVVWLAALHF